MQGAELYGQKDVVNWSNDWEAIDAFEDNFALLYVKEKAFE